MNPQPTIQVNADVEAFLIHNKVQPHAETALRNLSLEAQTIVLGQGSLFGSRDPTAVLLGRIAKANRGQTSSSFGNNPPGISQPSKWDQQDGGGGGGKGGKDATGEYSSWSDWHSNWKNNSSPGDWTCPNCGDHNFAKNKQCRNCGFPRPEKAGNDSASTNNSWSEQSTPASYDPSSYDPPMQQLQDAPGEGSFTQAYEMPQQAYEMPQQGYDMQQTTTNEMAAPSSKAPPTTKPAKIQLLTVYKKEAGSEGLGFIEPASKAAKPKTIAEIAAESWQGQESAWPDEASWQNQESWQGQGQDSSWQDKDSSWQDKDSSWQDQDSSWKNQESWNNQESWWNKTAATGPPMVVGPRGPSSPPVVVLPRGQGTLPADPSWSNTSAEAPRVIGPEEKAGASEASNSTGDGQVETPDQKKVRKAAAFQRAQGLATLICFGLTDVTDETNLTVAVQTLAAATGDQALAVGMFQQLGDRSEMAHHSLQQQQVATAAAKAPVDQDFLSAYAAAGYGDMTGATAITDAPATGETEEEIAQAQYSQFWLQHQIHSQLALVESERLMATVDMPMATETTLLKSEEKGRAPRMIAGDWICRGCGDHQFARNRVCRHCGAAKPPLSEILEELKDKHKHADDDYRRR